MKVAHHFAWTALLSLVCIGAVGCSAGDPTNDIDDVAEHQDELAVRRACGGPANLQCRKDQFCDAVRPGRCPSSKQIGKCATRPQICTDQFDPVCGCDGVTYPNACNAAAAGVAVASRGECAPSGQFCGGIAGFPCPEGQTCIDDPSDDCDPNRGGADCGGICVQEPTNPCAAVLCPVGTECVVEGKEARCVARCGDVTCGPGLVCCNPLLGICTPPGGICIF